MPPRLKHRPDSSFSLKSLYSVSFLNLIDAAAQLARSGSRPSDKPIVLFAKMDGIGDFLIWSTVFDALDRIFPGDRYYRVLAGDQRWAELARDDAPVDERIFFSNPRFAFDPLYRLNALRRIRGVNADIAINFRLTRRFIWEDAMVRASGAPVRIGSRGIDNLMTPLQERVSNRWYTRLIPTPAARMHESEAHREFLTSISDAVDIAPSPQPAPHRGKHTVFLIGAADAGKRWPAEKLAPVINVVGRTGQNVYLCGGAADRPAADQIKSLLDIEITDLVGKTSLPELAEIVSSARLVIGNDTGAAHLATLAGVPTVVITPGHHVGRFFPYSDDFQLANGLRQLSVVGNLPCLNCGWFCVHPDAVRGQAKPCIEQVSVEDVLAAIERVLEGRAAPVEC